MKKICLFTEFEIAKRKNYKEAFDLLSKANRTKAAKHVIFFIKGTKSGWILMGKDRKSQAEFLKNPEGWIIEI